MNDEDRRQTLQNLIDLAKSKEQNMRKIEDVTKLQGDLIAEEDIQALFKAIEDRESYMETVDNLDRKINLLYEVIQTTYEDGDLNGEEILLYKDLQAILQDIHDLVNQVYKQDKINMDMLKNRQKQYAEGIKRVKQGTKRQEAYKSYAPIDGGIFIDEKQ